MKKILILGNSIAAVSAIEEIRAKDQSSEITMLAFDGYYPCHGERFAEFITRDITEEQTAYQPKEFYEKNQVNVICNKKISRINLKRKKVFTEDKEQIDFDVLLITDLPGSKFPDIKGTNKTGTFGLKRFSDIKQIFDCLPLTETVVIQSDYFSGLQIAAALTKRKKEVVLLSSEESMLSAIFSTSVLTWLGPQLEERALRVLTGHSIAEILGNGDLKAIRLSSGKVLASDLVLLGDVGNDLRMIADSGLKLNKKICVDGQFKTNLENIFALDHMYELNGNTPIKEANNVDPDFISTAELQAQGKVVGATLNDEEAVQTNALVVRQVALEGLSIIIMGEVVAQERWKVLERLDEQAKVYRKVLIQEGNPVGAVLINADREKDQFLRLLEGNGNLTEIEALIMGGGCENAQISEAISPKEPNDNSVDTAMVGGNTTSQTASPETGEAIQEQSLGEPEEEKDLGGQNIF